jgi:hypothetical protein
LFLSAISEETPFPASFMMRQVHNGPDPSKALDELYDSGATVDSRPSGPCQYCPLPTGPCKECWRRVIVPGSTDHLHPRGLSVPVDSTWEYEAFNRSRGVCEVIREHYYNAPHGPCRCCIPLDKPCRTCYEPHWKAMNAAFREWLESRRRATQAAAVTAAAAAVNAAVVAVQQTGPMPAPAVGSVVASVRSDVTEKMNVSTSGSADIVPTVVPVVSVDLPMQVDPDPSSAEAVVSVVSDSDDERIEIIDLETGVEVLAVGRPQSPLYSSDDEEKVLIASTEVIVESDHPELKLPPPSRPDVDPSD